VVLRADGLMRRTVFEILAFFKFCVVPPPPFPFSLVGNLISYFFSFLFYIFFSLRVWEKKKHFKERRGQEHSCWFAAISTSAFDFKSNMTDPQTSFTRALFEQSIFQVEARIPAVDFFSFG
jgi:hypothetical protein